MGRHGILDGYYLPPILSEPEGASALLLAGRLPARHSDEHNPLIVQAPDTAVAACPPQRKRYSAVRRHRVLRRAIMPGTGGLAPASYQQSSNTPFCTFHVS